MGLAGRKQKQRIPADPRNLSWADDASRFGLSYLSKFGWDASQGLGSSGEGMKTHIKVQQKLDMMGIGAQHQRDPSGVAWKQNKDFEALLKRLNENVNDGQGDKGDEMSRLEIKIGEKRFIRAQEKIEEKSQSDDSVKKRKHESTIHPDSTGKKRKKEKKIKHDISSIPAISSSFGLSSTQSSSGSPSSPTSKPRPMAHRARIRAAKCIADKSASAISEILGIASSSSVSSSSVSSSTPTPAPTPPSSSTLDSEPSLLPLDNLTTSTKSVADYFKEKLLARSTTPSTPSTPQSLSGSSTPGIGTTRLGIGPSYTHAGIGSHIPAFTSPSQMSRSGPAFGDGDDDADGQDTAAEKARRKAERKARKRRGSEAQQPTLENSRMECVEEAPMKSAHMTPEGRKKKKRQE